ncbi:thioredoxin [Candidatus Phytoplasma meliae]|uniref:Thioredoxin n=1 Tax=Candidatus Phytoplasma meliae TaxID=1848402 RepID=A0ABS5CXH8_9MOLU|nr:thioredoxin [Candidatus Phytoplasma meliae]MBP5835684.1 thioredoxin [Candidatus Phytoplasma meliae]
MPINQVINYQGENFKELLHQKELVLVDFFATWCPPCQKLAPILEEVAVLQKEVLFVKVDIDAYRQLTLEHQISSFPTLILYKNKKELLRQVGSLDKKSLLDLLNTHQ